MRRQVIVSLLVCGLVMFPVACKRADQPAESTARGNSTDRSADGTTGTGVPASVANDSAAVATQMGTGGTSGTTGSGATATSTAPIAVTGTMTVGRTDTSTTLVTPTTTTISQASPTDTSSTVSTRTPKH